MQKRLEDVWRTVSNTSRDDMPYSNIRPCTPCVPLLQVLTTNPVFSSLLRYFRHRPFRGCYNKAMTKLPTCCSLSSSAFSSLRPSSSAACAGLLCFSKILGPSHCRWDRGKNGNFTRKNGDLRKKQVDLQLVRWFFFFIYLGGWFLIVDLYLGRRLDLWSVEISGWSWVYLALDGIVDQNPRYASGKTWVDRQNEQLRSRKWLPFDTICIFWLGATLCLNKTLVFD